ncbi:hypothetical protein K458DRAFT_434039 [Lentithecium fluviatile CBS 122367]|uniref:Uncharacterized protein n=1 Tax=Lentithecium fluviatile CBS 122367 TaxID=1168545 RepID=A0A6G1IR78_9PLEO|nr:hypothetical protein K458DRAFT_434039 [Lentithecium fluviatile CBS 122367]
MAHHVSTMFRMASNDVAGALASLQATVKEDREAHQLAKACRDRTNIQIEAYVRGSCLALCEEVLTRLPCELRDLIFGHIIGGTDTGIHLSRGLMPGSLNGLQGFFDEAQPCWDSDFVGADFLAEMTERLYRTMRSRFHDAAALRTFFAKDAFGLGLNPADLGARAELQHY